MSIHGTLRPDELCHENLIAMIIHGSLRPDELRRENLIAMIIHGIRLLRVVALDIPTAMTHGLRLGEMVALDIPIAMIHDPEARSLLETRLREEIIVVTPGEADQEKGVQEPLVHEISTRDLRVEDHLPETLSIPGLKETTRGRRLKEHRPEALIEASIPGPTGTVGTVARPPVEIVGVSKVQIPLDFNFFTINEQIITRKTKSVTIVVSRIDWIDADVWNNLQKMMCFKKISTTNITQHIAATIQLTCSLTITTLTIAAVKFPSPFV